MVASAHNDQWVDLWDGGTGQPVGQHRVPDRYGVVNVARFSGDSTRLVVGTLQGWVYAVDASTYEVVGTPVQVKPGPHVRPRREPRRRSGAGRDRPQLQLARPRRRTVLRTTEPRLDDFSWAWLPDGKAVVVVGGGPSQDGHGTVAFLDPDTLATTDKVSGPQVAGRAGDPVLFRRQPVHHRRVRPRRALGDLHRQYLGSVRAEPDSTAGFVEGTSAVLITSGTGRSRSGTRTPRLQCRRRAASPGGT